MSKNLSPGFALPLAIVAVGLLALGLVMAVPTSDLLAREVRHARARLALERTATIAETRIGYLLLTEPVGLRGLSVGGVKLAVDGSLIAGRGERERGEIVLDGRPYRLSLDAQTQLIVRVQEKAGLLNLVDARPEAVRRVMQACGWPRDEAAAAAQTVSAAQSWFAAADESAFDEVSQRLSTAFRASLNGDQQRRLDTATSVLPAGTGLHLPTAPRPVVLALFGNNHGVAEAYLASREGQNNTTTMAINISQTEYSLLPGTVKRGSMTGKMRVTIAIEQSQLTIGLPLYFYQSDMEVDLDFPDRSFAAKDPIVNAGRYAQCTEPLGEVVEPLPGPWRAGR